MSGQSGTGALTGSLHTYGYASLHISSSASQRLMWRKSRSVTARNRQLPAITDEMGFSSFGNIVLSEHAVKGYTKHRWFTATELTWWHYSLAGARVIGKEVFTAEKTVQCVWTDAPSRLPLQIKSEIPERSSTKSCRTQVTGQDYTG